MALASPMAVKGMIRGHVSEDPGHFRKREDLLAGAFLLTRTGPSHGFGSVAVDARGNDLSGSHLFRVQKKRDPGP